MTAFTVISQYIDGIIFCEHIFRCKCIYFQLLDLSNRKNKTSRRRHCCRKTKLLIGSEDNEFNFMSERIVSNNLVLFSVGSYTRKYNR